MRLGGWHRIGVVLSAIWCLFVGGYWFYHRLDDAKAIDTAQIIHCTDAEDDAYAKAAQAHDPNADSREQAVWDACTTAANAQFFRAADAANQQWPWVLVFCAVSLGLAWFTVWLLSALVRWVARGFSEPTNKRRAKAQSISLQQHRNAHDRAR